MDQEKYIEMIVDSYDGNLDAEGERSLREAMDADPSLREMYRLYGESLSLEVPAEVVDTKHLRKKIVDGIAFRRRAPLCRIVATVSAAAVIAAVVLTVTLSPRHYHMQIAKITETVDMSMSADTCSAYYDINDVMAHNVLEETTVSNIAADETVIPPVKLKPTHIRSIVEVTAESVGLREEFILATPMHMIEVEYDPAEMLCGISEVPVINAGHTRLSTSGGFTDKISQIVRILK